MDADWISLMQHLAPDLSEEMVRRTMILERIGTMQPVGRRQLAASLHLPEREIRNTALLLKNLGYIRLDSGGMSLTEAANGILPQAEAFSKVFSGIAEMEIALSGKLGVDEVLIARGNADEEEATLAEVGRLCAGRLRSLLRNGSTLAVSGGNTVASVARAIQTSSPMNVMVVPARGGMGRSAELQANTLASEIASRIGGHYRLIHIPDHLDEAAMQEMLKVSEVREVMDLVRRADIVLHGISTGSGAVHDSRLSRKEQTLLKERNARGECFGSYYDLDGNCLLRLSSVGVDLGKLNPSCQMIAAAAGAVKAEAIIAVMRSLPHRLLVTDESAALRMLELLG